MPQQLQLRVVDTAVAVEELVGFKLDVPGGQTLRGARGQQTAIVRAGARLSGGRSPPSATLPALVGLLAFNSSATCVDFDDPRQGVLRKHPAF